MFDFELHEAHTDGNFDEDSDDVREKTEYKLNICPIFQNLLLFFSNLCEFYN